jgi:hypothetical protein
MSQQSVAHHAFMHSALQQEFPCRRAVYARNHQASGVRQYRKHVNVNPVDAKSTVQRHTGKQ